MPIEAERELEHSQSPVQRREMRGFIAASGTASGRSRDCKRAAPGDASAMRQAMRRWCAAGPRDGTL